MFGGPLNPTKDPLEKFCKERPGEAAKLIRRLIGADTDYLNIYREGKHELRIDNRRKKSTPGSDRRARQADR